jgi:hypothetical protein
MIESLILIFIGALIGWHVPEPAWANNLKNRVLTYFRK